MSARDYKKRTKRPLDITRLREFGIGAAVGAIVAGTLVIYLRPPGPAVEAPRPEPRRQSREAPKTVAEPEGEQLDFYEMLPKFEVVVPEKDREVERNLPTAPIERPGVYVLQAGSYPNKADADRLRAQFARQGIDANVQRVSIDNDVWYRIRIGPSNDLRELNRLRARLQATDIDSLVIRVGD